MGRLQLKKPPAKRVDEDNSCKEEGEQIKRVLYERGREKSMRRKTPHGNFAYHRHGTGEEKHHSRLSRCEKGGKKDQNKAAGGPGLTAGEPIVSLSSGR